MESSTVRAACVLGLDETATLSDVRRVRRELVLKYHPDQSIDQERATRHMARVNAAADTLVARLTGYAARTTGQSPIYPDFSALKRTAQERRSEQRSSAEQPAQAHPKSGSSTHMPKQKVQKKTSRTMAPTLERKTVSNAESALNSFASASYAKVLNQIGCLENTPNIDLQVLKFKHA